MKANMEGYCEDEIKMHLAAVPSSRHIEPIEFMTEMRETTFILQNVSQRSLILMDELGRATSSSDGFAVAWSCCEHLLSLKAYTIFATHMENLSDLTTLYPNVKILHFHVDIRNNRLNFKFCQHKKQPIGFQVSTEGWALAYSPLWPSTCRCSRTS